MFKQHKLSASVLGKSVRSQIVYWSWCHPVLGCHENPLASRTARSHPKYLLGMVSGRWLELGFGELVCPCWKYSRVHTVSLSLGEEFPSRNVADGNSHHEVWKDWKEWRWINTKCNMLLGNKSKELLLRCLSPVYLEWRTDPLEAGHRPSFPCCQKAECALRLCQRSLSKITGTWIPQVHDVCSNSSWM